PPAAARTRLDWPAGHARRPGRTAGDQAGPAVPQSAVWVGGLVGVGVGAGGGVGGLAARAGTVRRPPGPDVAERSAPTGRRGARRPAGTVRRAGRRGATGSTRAASTAWRRCTGFARPAAGPTPAPGEPANRTRVRVGVT